MKRQERRVEEKKQEARPRPPRPAPGPLGGDARDAPTEGAAPEELDQVVSMLGDMDIEVDTPVEVRSRFHDRWIYGFAIAEAIETGAGPCRYRLTRRSDGIPLPILFDACDVRAAAPAFERNPVD